MKPGRLLPAILLAFAISQGVYAQLSGTYTIDGSKSASSSNYQTFASAVSDMSSGTRADGGTANGKGVSGVVVFKIADGTYTEQISIGLISGVSSTNTVTFESLSGDSSKVILAYPSSSSSTNDYVLQLDKTDYFVFRKITIQRTGTANYGTVIYLLNGASYDKFINCRLIGPKWNKSGTTYVINGSGAHDTGLVITGCLIKNTRYAVSLSGATFPSNTYGVGNGITNNIIDSAWEYAILASTQESILVKGNEIRNCAFGMNFRKLKGFNKITHNQIHSPSTIFSTTGFSSESISIINSDSTTGNKEVLVANNMIAGVDFGILINEGANVKVIHNSVLARVAVSLTRSSGALVNGVVVLNNIFSMMNNSGRFYAFSGVSWFDSSDYNVFSYVPNSNAVLYYNLRDVDLPELLLEYEPHSSFAAVGFKSGVDLHSISNGTHQKGTNTTYVTDDFDGEKRSTLRPDAGADETIHTLDASLFLFIASAPFCDTTADIKVTVHNNGEKNLDSLRLTYLVDTAKKPVQKFSIALSPDKDTVINLARIAIDSKPKAIKVFLSYPNGSSQDDFKANDTATRKFFRMNGNYTVCDKNCDYKTFFEVHNDLQQRGICGPVTFTVKKGTYYTPSLRSVKGATRDNRITFQTQNANKESILIAYDPGRGYTNTPVLSFDGGDYYTFKNFFIRKYDGSCCIELKGGACNNEFVGNWIHQLYGIPFNMPYPGRVVVFSPETSIDSANKFIENDFYGAYSAVQLNGTSGQYENGNVFIGNTFKGFVYYAMEVAGQDSFVLADNEFSYYYTTSYQTCLDFKNLKQAFITGNSFEGTAYHALRIQTALAPSSRRGLIANNMFATFTNKASAVVRLSDVQNYDIVFNSLYHRGYYQSRGLYITNSSSSNPGNNTLFNNIIVDSAGTALEVTADGVKNKSLIKSDNNDFYRYVTNTLAPGLISWNGSAHSSVSSYSSASGLDSNSISVNPQFVKYNNLHATDTALLKKGRSIKNVTVDFDKEVRDSKPDIGADEFGPPTHDLGIVKFVSPQPSDCSKPVIIVRVKNLGHNKIDSAKLTLTIDNVVHSARFYKLSLDPGYEKSVTLDTLTTKPGGAYLLMVVSSSPNDSIDTRPWNDTLRLKTVIKLQGTFTIGGAGSNYAKVYEASADLFAKGVCGPVVFKISDGIYNEQPTFSGIPGASATNTIRYESASGDSSKVIIQSAGNMAVLISADAKYYEFAGITIRKKTSSSAYKQRVLWVNGDPRFITFRNCQFIGSSASSQDTLIEFDKYFDSEDITIQNCHFKYGSLGIYLGSENLTGNNVQITGNTFDSLSEAAITAEKVVGFTIKNNRITGLAGGIKLIQCGEGFICDANYIYYKKQSGYFYGIFSYNSKGTLAKPGIISNNMIIGNELSTGSVTSFGLYIENSSHIHILHNSILIKSSDYSSTPIYAAISAPTYTGNRLLNNIFANFGEGYAAILPANKAFFTRSDFNDYYSKNASDLIYCGGRYSSLAAFTKAMDRDSNSLNVDPKYESESDLHTRRSVFNGRALPTGTVTTDFDSEKRSAAPDIGADEFDVNRDVIPFSLISPVDNNCGDSNTVISVVVQNVGLQKVDSIPVTVQISGSATLTLRDSIFGGLQPGAKQNIQLKTKLNSHKGATYNFTVYTSLKGDEERSDDTLYSVVKLIGVPAKPVIAGTTICGKKSVTLMGDSSYTVKWYSSDSTNIPLYTGATFVTPQLSVTTTYYASYSTAGCEGQRTAITIKCLSAPKASFKVTVGCKGISSVFANTTPDPDSSFSYAWSFGDGSTSSLYSPTHIYTANGTFIVKLIVSNQGICTDSLKQNISIYDAPASPVISDTVVCGSQKLTKLASLPSSATLWYDHATGGTPVYTGNNFTAVYTGTKTYYVAFKRNGCEGPRSSFTVTVYPLPVADFSATDVCLGKATQLTNKSTNSQGAITKYYWLFDGTDTSSAQNPSYTFSSWGVHQVVLMTENSMGCRDSVTKQVTVFALPQVSFTKSTNANQVTFTSIVTDAGPVSYSWNFGDASTSTSANPTHTYASKGAYTVKLTVKNANGCEKTITDTVNINTIGLDENPIRGARVNIYPNPFTKSTTLEYELAKSALTEAKLYDVQGREIATIVRSTRQSAGKYSYTLSAGELKLKAGAYIVRLSIDGKAQSEQVIKLK